MHVTVKIVLLSFTHSVKMRNFLMRVRQLVFEETREKADTTVQSSPFIPAT